MSDWVLEAGGEMVSTNSSKIVDFMIVPFNSDVVKSKKSKEVVSNLWLEGNKTSVLVQWGSRNSKLWRITRPGIAIRLKLANLDWQPCLKVPVIL